MTIRLDALRTFGENVKDWFRLTLPLICVVRYVSDRPIDWLFFWIGWKFLRSSATYFLEINDDGEKLDSTSHARGNKSENDSHLSHTRLKKFAAMGTEAPDLRLTSMPSATLSDIACYLHPRDVLNLDTVLRSGMKLRNSQDGTDGSRISRTLYDGSVGQDIWKRLWYRDYGDVLLRWKVSREAFRHSLNRSSRHSTEVLDYRDDKNMGNAHLEDRLEESLSKRLDEMTGISMSTTMKDFYFVFGECFIDYVLATKNTMDECYLGLHGHIFDFKDFAEFHPGLIEPILKECGGDATHYFEDLPHSSGARNIARRLCVVVDHNAIDYEDDGHSSRNQRCGLELIIGTKNTSQLKDVLRSTNTRPLSPISSNKNSRVEQTRKNQWIAHLVPRRRKWRRHPTVNQIRMRFQQEQQRHRQQQNGFQNTSIHDFSRSNSGSNLSFVTTTTELLLSCSPFRGQQTVSRIYYDPLAQEWSKWYPAGNTTR